MTWVPALPLASVKSRVKVTVPSASLSCTITAQVQVLPAVLVNDSALVADVPPNLISQVGVPIVSDAAIVIVIVLPSLLSVVVGLLDAIATEVRVGAVMSAVQANVLDTVLPLVTESVYAPAFTLTVTAPLAEAVQVAE